MGSTIRRGENTGLQLTQERQYLLKHGKKVYYRQVLKEKFNYD